MSDDEFAARLRDAENELVDSYVGGVLAGELRERFESFYLASPTRREKVAFARVLQTVINRATVTQGLEVAKLVSEPTTRARAKPDRGPRTWFHPTSRMAWGLTGALVLLLAVGSWLTIQNARLRTQVAQIDTEYQALRKREAEVVLELQQQRSSDLERQKELEALREKIAALERKRPPDGGPPFQEPNVIAVVLAPQTRSVSQIAHVGVPADADYGEMRLELERGDFSFYRAELKSLTDNRSLWRSGMLRARGAGDSKSVNVTLPASLLKPQTYMVEVSGIAADRRAELIGSYPFRVERQ